MLFHTPAHPKGPSAPGCSSRPGGAAALSPCFAQPPSLSSTASQREAQPHRDPLPVLTYPLTIPLPCPHLFPPCLLPYPFMSSLSPPAPCVSSDPCPAPCTPGGLPPCSPLVRDSLPAHPCPSRPGQDSASSWKPLSSLTQNQDVPVLFPSPDTPSAVRPTGQDCGHPIPPPPTCRFPGFHGTTLPPVLPNPLTLVSRAPAAHPPVEPRDRGWMRGLSRGRDKVGCTPHPGDGDTDGFQGEGGSLRFSREKTQELHWPPTPQKIHLSCSESHDHHAGGPLPTVLLLFQ